MLQHRLVPDAVVRGLQLAVGLPLAQTGIKNVWLTVSEVHTHHSSCCDLARMQSES